MKYAKHIGIFCILVIIAVTIITITTNNQPRENEQTPEKEVITIGALLPLTGKESAAGYLAKQGIDLAIKQLNDSNSKYYFETIYEDTKTQPKETLNAYQQLQIKNSNIDFILTLGSPFAIILSPVVNENEQLLFAIASSPDYASENDYTFRIIPAADKDGKYIADALITKLNINKAAVFTQNNDYGIGSRSGFVSIYKSQGGTIIHEEMFNPDDFDFKTQLLRLKEKNPPAIMLASWAKQAGKIIRQAKEINLDTQFICGQACNNPDYFAEAGLAGDGTIIVTLNHNKSGDFYSSFVNEYDREPNFISEKMYDSVFIINQLLSSCDNKKCYLDKLASESFATSSGKVTFDSVGDISEELTVFKVKENRLIPLE